MLTRLAKNQCPYLDAAAANLQKRLGGGTDGMDADTWADGTRVYGELSFVYSFNPPNMITVNVTHLWENDPVENFTQIMMNRIRHHVSDFQKDEGRQISVSVCIFNHKSTHGFVKFFKVT